MQLYSVVLAALLAAGAANAQNVSSSMKGAIVDPSHAAVPKASVTVVQADTGATRAATSNEAGAFVLPSLPAGVYRLTVESQGFRTSVRDKIDLTAGEIRDLGEIVMSLGSVNDSVTVSDTPTPLQTASGERSGLVSGEQLEELAIKGRDFLGLAVLIPGVVDDGSQGRETTGPNATAGIFINGGRSDMKNLTVDGVSAIDTGSNNAVHYEPNMSSIAEVKILTSNYQAEYGRSGGGLISVVTKGGGKDFSGTAWWTHRNEEFNANDFFRNRSGLPVPPYRYNIAGFGVGGPIYVPKHFNTSRSKLFFFVSQEYTRQRVDAGSQFRSMPTQFERQGDFSQSKDTNGKLLTIIDPTTAKAFPGGIIPQSRINKIGQGILNFYPLPNYVDSDPKLVYSRNYAATASGYHPRRNDMARSDWYPTDKLHAYFRWIHDDDISELPYQAFNFNYSNVQHPNPGRGYSGSMSYIFKPTLLNEVTVGLSSVNWQWGFDNPDAVSRGAVAPIPQWFPNQPTSDRASEAIDAKLMPNISFGGTPASPPTVTINNLQHTNYDRVWDVNDNISYVVGAHSLKAGLYFSLRHKIQIQGDQWNGSLDFSVNKSNPNDTGDAFANAILGNFNTYTESTRGINFNNDYRNVEFYIQDNWRVSKGLTLDYGLRFYSPSGETDQNQSFSSFDPSAYSRANAPVLYVPGFDSKKARVAVNPLTGATAGVELIGKYVPGTGNTANGFKVGGTAGVPGSLYTIPVVTVAPRFGFAYSPTKFSKTAIRGGVGFFYDRPRAMESSLTANNPPVAYRPTAYYGNLDTFAQNTGIIGPSAATFPAFVNGAKQPEVINYNFSVQRMLPFSSVVDVAYVGSISRHLLQGRNLNAIPAGARLDPANGDPTSPGKPLIDDLLRPYYGLGNLTVYEFASASNYNSLQVSAQRRFTKRLGFGVAYTWSRALGVASTFDGAVSSYFSPRKWNYGPLSFDRNQVLTLNYNYDLPKPGAALHSRLLGAIVDNWAVSGVSTFYSGAPLNPTLTTSSGAEISGSTEAARLTVVGDPILPASERTFNRNFNQAAFALTPVGSFGNAGYNILRQPGRNLSDVALSRRIPLGSEKRNLQFRAEAFNVANHTQFTTIDGAARFDATGKQISSTFGAYTASTKPRVISLALRLRF